MSDKKKMIMRSPEGSRGSRPPSPGGFFGLLDQFASGCWLMGHNWRLRSGRWVCVECGKAGPR